MTKSELIDKLATLTPKLSVKDVELGVKKILECMVVTLKKKQRIEIRGFGSFSLHQRKPRMARNPKTGEAVRVGETFMPHFKPGKELREEVNRTRK